MGNIRYRPDSELNEIATSFLARYHPCKSLPVPIEEILELELKIEIVPQKGLRSKHGTDGFISIDLQTITVDQDLLTKKALLPRLRFTLAHELGHRELHAQVIPCRFAKTEADWKGLMSTIDPEMHKRLEFQASRFAGFMLVASDTLNILIQEFEQVCEGNETQLLSKLASKFAVSHDAMRVRMDCERSLLSASKANVNTDGRVQITY